MGMLASSNILLCSSSSNTVHPNSDSLTSCTTTHITNINMKINIAAPANGLQKLIEIDDEKRLQNLYDRRIAQEIDGSVLGDEFNGYALCISGGNDKQGFPMRQGILTNTRVRILCAKGQKG